MKTSNAVVGLGVTGSLGLSAYFLYAGIEMIKESRTLPTVEERRLVLLMSCFSFSGAFILLWIAMGLVLNQRMNNIPRNDIERSGTGVLSQYGAITHDKPQVPPSDEQETVSKDDSTKRMSLNN